MKFILFCVLGLFICSCTKKDLHKNKQHPIVAYYDKAWAFNDRGKADSAFIYFFKAKEVFTQLKDSIGISKCLINMGIIMTDQGDYFGAQETSLQALKFLDTANVDHCFSLASNFNNLGIATTKLQEYKKSIYFFEMAIRYSIDNYSKVLYQNNEARSYQSLAKYNDALKIYNVILKRSAGNQTQYSRVLSNIAKTKWLQNPAYQPLPEFWKALQIRVQNKDLWGQNSSYAHLADYYLKSKPDSALYYAQKMYAIANRLKSPDDRKEALQKLITVSPPQQTKTYFATYRHLDDSLNAVRSAAKNQFTLIRYETEKSKADNLKLQKDIAIKKYQIITQRIYLIGGAVFLILASVISILWFRKRKQKLQLQAQNAVREGQLKISKKVHDVVANGLYRVMTEIENQQNIDREGILDRLEYMYEKSRDISYEEEKIDKRDFHTHLTDLLKSFASDSVRVVYLGSSTELWDQVNNNTKQEIEHVLQELMVNMAKHSGGSDVAIRFEQLDHHIHIYYTDNGRGITEGTKFNNGLTSTGNRIKSIGGTITFETKAEIGLKIQISFPIR